MMRALKQGLWIGILSIGLMQCAYAILPIEKLNSFKGAKVFLVQTQALPMVDIEISIDAGDRYDPVDKSGLADMAAGLMSYGARGYRLISRGRACNYADSKFEPKRSSG